MRNRAKCKLCNAIIESFHLFDFVRCSCDEIGISGGQLRYDCSAKNWENFLRVDDDDKEFPVKVIQKTEDKNMETPKEDPPPLTKSELLKELETMLKNIETLPQNALSSPISHFDLYSYFMVVLAILKHPDN